jgi:predicted glycogen debranching enzyme
VITYGTQVTGSLPEGATREWLVPDGRGGYAMGTVSGLRTRRYHCLLAVAGSTPGQRQVALVALDPVLRLPSGATARLGTHEWASGALAPAGYAYLERFDLVDGLPRWRWRIGGLVLERVLAMLRQDGARPALGVVHRLVAGGPVRLELEALCTWRDQHAERYASGPPPRVEQVADGAVVEGAYRLAGPGWQPAGEWYVGARLREEVERGLAAQEDLWLAGRFAADLAGPGEVAEVCAWAGDRGQLADPPPPASEIVAAARRRAARVVAAANPADDVAATLALAADAFIVEGGAGPDVVAGYPWFGAWSRDTMISYEGLFLATGRAEQGRELLRAYAGTVSEGMLANTTDSGRPEYNTVDGTLWFIHAVGRHVAATGDNDLAAELLSTLDDILAAHQAGTRYGIRADPTTGLLRAGALGYALTWMDACVHGVPVTPRIGEPVEVNALWVNALGTIAALRPGGATGGAFERASEAFRRAYAPTPGGWLPDLAGTDRGDGTDRAGSALRPNQLLAYGLPYAPLRGQRPPAAVTERLLTPLGLRSLAPDQPGYQGRHRGDPAARDAAYHQGTVWPWLIGPYLDAIRAAGDRDLADPLAGLAAHLSEYGLGSVSETADGDPPHRATGCPFQAWSVAETLRAWISTG